MGRAFPDTSALRDIGLTMTVRAESRVQDRGRCVGGDEQPDLAALPGWRSGQTKVRKNCEPAAIAARAESDRVQPAKKPPHVLHPSTHRHPGIHPSSNRVAQHGRTRGISKDELRAYIRRETHAGWRNKRREAHKPDERTGGAAADGIRFFFFLSLSRSPSTNRKRAASISAKHTHNKAIPSARAMCPSQATELATARCGRDDDDDWPRQTGPGRSRNVDRAGRVGRARCRWGGGGRRRYCIQGEWSS